MNEPEVTLPTEQAPLLNLDDDTPLACPYQHPSLHGDDEICEACQ